MGANTGSTRSGPGGHEVAESREEAVAAASDLSERVDGDSFSAGDVHEYLRGLDARAELSASEERRLVERAQRGDEGAREQLIERYLPAIGRMAREFRADGASHADLVQEGCVGLLRALSRYEPSRGVPFWAYASHWVRHGLQELRADAHRGMRLPPKALRKLARTKSGHSAFYTREGREPTRQELADELDVGLDDLEALMLADRTPRSLDQPFEGPSGEVGALGDLLADPLSAADYETVLDELAGTQVARLLTRLSARDRDVIRRRFGLDGHAQERLAEVGDRMGISAERVRQIEERGLAKLRKLTA